MISIDKSYDLGMSSNAFYQSEKDELLKLIEEKGECLHVFSRSMDCAVLVSAIPLVNGFVLTADGDIVSHERWMPLDGIKPTLKRQPIKPGIRFQVLKRDGYRCQMCGVTAQDGAKLEIDHIHPVSKGGSNELSNLQVLCRDCNAGKRDQLL